MEEKGVVVREEMGGREVALPTTAGIAIAAQLTAVIKARHAIALANPRDIETVRQKILKDCRRPKFAETGMYRRPVGAGKVVEGLSIRFAEAALRAMGNAESSSRPWDEDDRTRTFLVECSDYESNVTHSETVIVNKIVERKMVREGQVVVGERTTSTGGKVKLVEASEQEMETKQRAQLSKAVRTLILRLVPGDIQDEARELIQETLKNQAAVDPDAEQKRIADAFARVHVTPQQLREYLGHPVNQCSPAELVALRQIYATLMEGETTWVEIVANKTQDEEAGREAMKATTAKLKATTPPPQKAKTPPPPAPSDEAEFDDDFDFTEKEGL